MIIATWNVNSIKIRVENTLAWLKERDPDIVCLQELKCVDEAFPREAFEAAGYNLAVHGQKTYNGVAILSKLPLEDVTPRLPGDDGDEQSRYLEAVVSTPAGAVRVGCLYLPNGNPLGTEKFTYKLGWMNRLVAHARGRLALEEPFLLCGDYNVIPMPEDAKNPKDWVNDALFQPESRGKLRELAALGFTDALRACDTSPGLYSFWDYQAGAWQRNNGIRIDHALLSPEAADLLTGVSIHRDVRAWDKPSDHGPLVVELDA